MDLAASQPRTSRVANGNQADRKLAHGGAVRARSSEIAALFKRPGSTPSSLVGLRLQLRPPDAKQSVQVVLRYADARRGQIVADAHVDDEVVKQIASAGKQQARRGRRPKT